MKVREQDLGGVLLSVINDLALRPGGVVTDETLEQNWARVGLRHADLELAISQLLDQDDLQREQPQQGHACFSLTVEGHKKSLGSTSALSLIASSAQRLRRSSQRRKKKTAGGAAEIPVEDRRR